MLAERHTARLHGKKSGRGKFRVKPHPRSAGGLLLQVACDPGTTKTPLSFDQHV